ncbi:MAG: porin [Myxococcota bacterium]|nr:porin [Myxococcota bacterium]
MTSSQPIVFNLPGEVSLTPVAQVQARVTVFDEDDSDRNDPVVYGDPGLSEGVSLRRVRLGLKANWRGVVGLSIVGGFDNRYDYTEPFGHNAKLTEATLSLTPLKEVGLTVGLTKVAFGRQAVTSSAHLALWERAMVSEHMAPDREAGVYLAGSFGPEDNKVLGENAVNWAFGVSNGGGDWTGDFDASPRLAGRLSLDLGVPWEDVESAWTQTGFGLSVGGSLSHNWGLEADSLLAGVDLGIRVDRFGLQGEFMVGNAVPTFDTEGIPGQLAERASLGGYGQIVFAILPGNLEATFRAGAYDDNVALDDAGDRLDLAGGINAYLLGGRLKAQLNFVHRMELTESAATSNDSLILQVQARL